MTQRVLETDTAADTPAEITAHVVNRILDTEQQLTPCYHKVLTPALPPMVYDAIMTHLPPDAAYRPARGAGHTQESIFEKLGCASSKQELWLPHLWDGTCSVALRDVQIAQWRDVYAGLSSPELVEGLAHTLRIANSAPLKPSIRLVRETGAAYVRPHLDRRKKVLTIVFYLGDPAESGAEGTMLYGPEPSDEESGQATPFAANTALFLPRLRESWHAVPAHRLRAPRLTLQFFLIYRAPA